jgi:hypothetical protein
MKSRNFGILVSISWNSNNWAAPATAEDIDNSNYDYVKENKSMHEDLNFAHDILPIEEDGTFIAYTPMFNTLPSEEQSKYVEIVFFRSLNYHIKKNFIVGLYAFPYIDEYDRNANHLLYKRYSWGNVASLPEHIILFKNPIEISNEIALKENFLPPGKKLGQQGFNYIVRSPIFRPNKIRGITLT